jgi:hypothetical protein
MKKWLAAGLLLVLCGCVSMAKVEQGERLLGTRLQVTIDGPWNHLSTPNAGPAETWTMEGLPVDQLLLYPGLPDGEEIHGRNHRESNARRFVFRAGMQPDEIVALFEGWLTRDGSRFMLTRLEPAPFAGQKGFRFEYRLTRNLDNVELAGLGYGVIDKAQLYALLYMAPRLTFFGRHQAQVERIAASARLKN